MCHQKAAITEGTLTSMDKTAVYFVVAVGCVSLVGIVALICGHDGSVLTAVIGAITASSGYIIGKTSGAKKGGNDNGKG